MQYDDLDPSRIHGTPPLPPEFSGPPLSRPGVGSQFPPPNPFSTGTGSPFPGQQTIEFNGNQIKNATQDNAFARAAKTVSRGLGHGLIGLSRAGAAVSGVGATFLFTALIGFPFGALAAAHGADSLTYELMWAGTKYNPTINQKAGGWATNLSTFTLGAAGAGLLKLGGHKNPGTVGAFKKLREKNESMGRSPITWGIGAAAAALPGLAIIVAGSPVFLLAYIVTTPIVMAGELTTEGIEKGKRIFANKQAKKSKTKPAPPKAGDATIKIKPDGPPNRPPRARARRPKINPENKPPGWEEARRRRRKGAGIERETRVRKKPEIRVEAEPEDFEKEKEVG